MGARPHYGRASVAEAHKVLWDMRDWRNTVRVTIYGFAEIMEDRGMNGTATKPWLVLDYLAQLGRCRRISLGLWEVFDPANFIET